MSPPRSAEVRRKTLETDVTIRLTLDGTGVADVETGIGFYDHLLDTLAHHAMVDLSVRTTGDLHVDEHHTVEDTALVLGQALGEALGDRTGIVRFADATVPMDDAVARSAIDVGGRPFASVDLTFGTDRIGTLGTQMIPHALESFAAAAHVTIHLTATGKNDHHIAEAAFKALAISLRSAVAVDQRRSGDSSTTGVL